MPKGMIKIAIHTVGVCGSDVHCYTHGKIGPFAINAPMVLDHEAAGTIIEVGAGVTISRAVTVSAWSRYSRSESAR